MEFVSHGPSRELGSVTELCLVFQLIDFYYNAVCGERKELPFPVPIADVFFDFVDAVADPALVGYREPP